MKPNKVSKSMVLRIYGRKVIVQIPMETSLGNTMLGLVHT